ncbi:hypothetical protein OESDEN_19604 [Oesophagostomum dentatum]|uniref:Uncharacterized protein n=1 Tax=Oesophagostomum dentatum TaxID=61180 RepID=A0A0B1SB12_OESDE|nr:hypothetical protein OESDEN_19604 [Oesophagostomum dentatum]
MTEYFKHVCFKLYVTAKRMYRNRILAAKLREKIGRKKKLHCSFTAGEQSWKQHLSIGVAQQVIQTITLDNTRKQRRFELKRNLVGEWLPWPLVILYGYYLEPSRNRRPPAVGRLAGKRFKSG